MTTSPYLRLGLVGWAGAILVFYFSYELTPGIGSYALIVSMGAVFGGLAWVMKPRAQAVEQAPSSDRAGDDLNAEAQRLRAPIVVEGASLDELKVSAETAKELVKTRDGGDLDLSMPGMSLRLGKPRDAAPRPDDGLPSTAESIGTLEQG